MRFLPTVQFDHEAGEIKTAVGKQDADGDDADGDYDNDHMSQITFPAVFIFVLIGIHGFLLSELNVCKSFANRQAGCLCGGIGAGGNRTDHDHEQPDGER